MVFECLACVFEIICIFGFCQFSFHKYFCQSHVFLKDSNEFGGNRTSCDMICRIDTWIPRIKLVSFCFYLLENKNANSPATQFSKFKEFAPCSENRVSSTIKIWFHRWIFQEKWNRDLINRVGNFLTQQPYLLKHCSSCYHQVLCNKLFYLVSE